MKHLCLSSNNAFQVDKVPANSYVYSCTVSAGSMLFVGTLSAKKFM